MMLLDTTVTAAPGASQFGVFEKLTDYGALGLIVLALGYVAWMFIQKKLKEIILLNSMKNQSVTQRKLEEK